MGEDSAPRSAGCSNSRYDAQSRWTETVRVRVVDEHSVFPVDDLYHNKVATQRQPCNIRQRSAVAVARTPSSLGCHARCPRHEWGNCQHSQRSFRSVAGKQRYHPNATKDRRRARAHGSTWTTGCVVTAVAERGVQRLTRSMTVL
eukprot:6194010-Pleurochrysis_carterae.AAC.1